MSLSVPPITPVSCNPPTTQASSALLRTRTDVEAAGGGERDGDLLPPRAPAPEASSPRAFRAATTASHVRQHAALILASHAGA